MQLREIADTGIRVSPIGLGTVKLGRDQGVKYPEQFTIPDDQQASSLLDHARDLGINLLDTAPAYGNSEIRLGSLMGSRRKDWVICTKVGEEFEAGQSYYRFDGDHVRMSIDRSMQRLRTDYLDLVLVHSNGEDKHIIEHYGILDQLAELKRSGLIRGFGMSTKTVEGGILAATHADCVMTTYNLDHREESAVLDYCAEHGRGVLVKKALGSGHLSKELDDPVQANLRFIFAHPAVNSAVLGTINPHHMAQNVAAYEAVEGQLRGDQN